MLRHALPRRGGRARAAWVHILALSVLPSQEGSRAGRCVLRAEVESTYLRAWHLVSPWHRLGVITSVQTCVTFEGVCLASGVGGSPHTCREASALACRGMRQASWPFLLPSGPPPSSSPASCHILCVRAAQAATVSHAGRAAHLAPPQDDVLG